MSHRDITAHRYQTLRMEDVFYTVKMDFPQIENQLKDILKAEKMNKIQRNIRHRARCSFLFAPLNGEHCLWVREAIEEGLHRPPTPASTIRRDPPPSAECFTYF